jgi:hypothetical protein
MAETPLQYIVGNYDFSFEGPALKLACIAILKNEHVEGLIARFRNMPEEERHVCLSQLSQSLNPAPDFTAEDVEHSITPGGQLIPEDPELAKRMNNRIALNGTVARAFNGLAASHLIDDSTVIPPLIECVAHPVTDIGRLCTETLWLLTRHSYGLPLWKTDSPLFTIEERARAVSDWRRYWLLMQHRHPIFDWEVERETLRFVRAIADQIEGLPPHYSLQDPRVELSGTCIYSYDSGMDARMTRDAIRYVLMFRRPGIANPESATRNTLSNNAPPPERFSFHELFPALDLEVFFLAELPPRPPSREWDTTDLQARQKSIFTVELALGGLRALDRR